MAEYSNLDLNQTIAARELTHIKRARAKTKKKIEIVIDNMGFGLLIPIIPNIGLKGARIMKAI